jgi:hypothetical protein
MDLVQFTSYEEVRAAIGVSEEELPDAVIGLPMYLQSLLLDLDEIHEDVDTTYVALTGTLDADEQRFQRLVQLFATYSVARTLLTGLDLFAPKRIQDGRAELERTEDPYAAVREGVLAMYGRVRLKLIEAFETLVPAAEVSVTTLTWGSSVGIAADPVTNE